MVAKAKTPKSEPKAPKAEVKAGLASERHPLHRRRTISGHVVSTKMQKTIVVEIDRLVKHPQYPKFITRTRRIKAHDEKGDAKLGDLVGLVETKPMSKDKRWALQSIIRRSGRTGADVNTLV